MSVIQTLQRFYCEDCANIHRGVHELSARATECYECSRGKVQRFLNAREEAEIIFVRGTTEAINPGGRKPTDGSFLVRGDEILISAMEHHSNIVPWQILCEMNEGEAACDPGSTMRASCGCDEFEKMVGRRAQKFVSLAHISNALGTVESGQAGHRNCAFGWCSRAAGRGAVGRRTRGWMSRSLM